MWRKSAGTASGGTLLSISDSGGEPSSAWVDDQDQDRRPLERDGVARVDAPGARPADVLGVTGAELVDGTLGGLAAGDELAESVLERAAFRGAHETSVRWPSSASVKARINHSVSA